MILNFLISLLFDEGQDFSDNLRYYSPKIKKLIDVQTFVSISLEKTVNMSTLLKFDTTGNKYNISHFSL